MTTPARPKQARGFAVAGRPEVREAPEPKWRDLAPLPGGPVGPPLLISNNPEIFTGNGMLGGSVLPSRGGRSLSGMPSLTEFGYYLFHINHAGSQRRVHLLASTPASRSVRAHVRGALFANAWGLKSSACVHTARAMLGTLPIDRVVEIRPGSVVSLGYIDVNRKECVDGRFFVDADGPVFVRDVAAMAGSSASVALVAGSNGFAPGEIKSPGPGAFGRCSGLYAHDGWRGTIAVSVDQLPFNEGFRFDDASQAHPGIAAFGDSDPRSTANYGSIYELAFEIQNASGLDAQISVELASYPGEIGPTDVATFVQRCKSNKPKPLDVPTRLWDGPAAITIDGKTEIRHLFTRPLDALRRVSPGSMRALIASRRVLAGRGMQFRVRIPVPGLISIPAAILIKATGARAGVVRLLDLPSAL